MELTSYETKLFENLLTKCTFDKWYEIDKNRPDREEFVNGVKKFIDIWGLAEFRDDKFDKFRLIYRFTQYEARLCMSKIDLYDGTIDQNQKDIQTVYNGIGFNRAYNIEYLEVPKTTLERRGPPPERPISEIAQRIVDNYNKMSEEKKILAMQEQERINKINEWKNQ